MPSTFYSLYLLQNPARNAPSAWHKFNPNVARRWNVARAVLFYFSRMRNENSILLSRGYRGGQRPRRTLKGGQGGTIVGSPCFFRFLSSEKGRINKKTISSLVLTPQETNSPLSTFQKKHPSSKKPDEKRKSFPAPSSAYFTQKPAEKRTPCLPASSVARRWNVARAVPSAPPPDEKRKLYLIEQELSRGGGLCPLPRPAKAFSPGQLPAPGSPLRSSPSLAFRPRGIEKLNLCPAPSTAYPNTTA